MKMKHYVREMTTTEKIECLLGVILDEMDQVAETAEELSTQHETRMREITEQQTISYKANAEKRRVALMDRISADMRAYAAGIRAEYKVPEVTQV